MTSEKSRCFVSTIPLNLAEKLRSDLVEQGFEIATPPYTVFSAKKKGISCTLYLSGKITVQGRGMEEFITFYLEPEILHTTTYSYPEAHIDTTPHIGIDESGKGDFFGPLCIAGVYADSQQIKELLAAGVRDSKQIGDSAIFKLSTHIKKICPHTVVAISPKKYNELYQKFHNLNHLLAWGHATAICELAARSSCRQVIIDQFASEHVVLNALKQKKIDISLTQRHRAEADPVVAAASILARENFLKGLERLSLEYGLTLPKGASSIVIKIGKAFVAKHGREPLGNVAKLHFKTKDEIFQ